jgi:hypothetical protein
MPYDAETHTTSLEPCQEKVTIQHQGLAWGPFPCLYPELHPQPHRADNPATRLYVDWYTEQ